jgi:hypothetical protein
MDDHSSILAAPMQPPLFRQCLSCGKLFALREVRIEHHALVGDVRVFRCTSCQREFQYAASHPPHVV